MIIAKNDRVPRTTAGGGVSTVIASLSGKFGAVLRLICSNKDPSAVAASSGFQEKAPLGSKANRAAVAIKPRIPKIITYPLSAALEYLERKSTRARAVNATKMTAEARTIGVGRKPEAAAAKDEAVAVFLLF